MTLVQMPKPTVLEVVNARTATKLHWSRGHWIKLIYYLSVDELKITQYITHTWCVLRLFSKNLQHWLNWSKIPAFPLNQLPICKNPSINSKNFLIYIRLPFYANVCVWAIRFPSHIVLAASWEAALCMRQFSVFPKWNGLKLSPTKLLPQFSFIAPGSKYRKRHSTPYCKSPRGNIAPAFIFSAFFYDNFFFLSY